MSKNWIHAPTANNTAATVTVPANEGVVRISSVEFSYDMNPTGGQVLIESPSGTVKRKQYVTAGGPGFLNLPEKGFEGEKNQAVVITLAAGGAGVTGVLNVTSE